MQDVGRSTLQIRMRNNSDCGEEECYHATMQLLSIYVQSREASNAVDVILPILATLAINPDPSVPAELASGLRFRLWSSTPAAP